jgi:hypothetical protein
VCQCVRGGCCDSASLAGYVGALSVRLSVCACVRARASAVDSVVFSPRTRTRARTRAIDRL